MARRPWGAVIRQERRGLTIPASQPTDLTPARLSADELAAIRDPIVEGIAYAESLRTWFQVEPRRATADMLRLFAHIAAQDAQLAEQAARIVALERERDNLRGAIEAEIQEPGSGDLGYALDWADSPEYGRH